MRRKTSALIMKRSLLQACAAAEQGHYSLLVYYTRQALQVAPSNSGLLERLGVLDLNFHRLDWAGWYSGLIARGYRPVRKRPEPPDLLAQAIARADKLEVLLIRSEKIAQDAIELLQERTVKLMALTAVEYDPEQLDRRGTTSAGAEPTPNPSHPVRSHVYPATWKQRTPSHQVQRYCACGVQLPIVVPEFCPECRRPTARKEPDANRTLLEVDRLEAAAPAGQMGGGAPDGQRDAGPVEQHQPDVDDRPAGAGALEGKRPGQNQTPV